jgi:hypothetical protein
MLSQNYTLAHEQTVTLVCMTWPHAVSGAGLGQQPRCEGEHAGWPLTAMCSTRQQMQPQHSDDLDNMLKHVLDASGRCAPPIMLASALATPARCRLSRTYHASAQTAGTLLQHGGKSLTALCAAACCAPAVPLRCSNCEQVSQLASNALAVLILLPKTSPASSY